MAANIPPHERQMIMLDAYELDISDVPQREITRRLSTKYSRRLGLPTISRLIQEQRAIELEALEDSKDDALINYLGINQFIIRDAMQRLSETAANAQNVPGLQSNVMAGAKNIATALGLLANKGENAVSVNINVNEYDLSDFSLDELRDIRSRIRVLPGPGTETEKSA